MHRSRTLLTIVAAATALVALAAPSGSLAAAGDLDPSFDLDGKLTTAFGETPFHPEDSGNAAARAPGGEIYVAGTSDDDFGLVRFTPAGAIDTTFGQDGIVITDVSGAGSEDEANAVTVDPATGEVVVAGISDDDFAVVRYTSAGALDTGFGGVGIVTTDIAGDREDSANAVALLPSGNVFVAGTTESDPDEGIDDYDFALAVFTDAGALEPAFDGDGGSGDGRVITDFGSEDDEANAVLVTSGPKILVAGRTDPTDVDDSGDFIVARYDGVTGELDDSFDTDGSQTVSFTPTGNADLAEALAIDSTDRILVAGKAGGGNGDFAVARLDGTTGALDNTFDTDGKQTVSTPASPPTLNSSDQCFAVAVQADGGIVLGGTEGGDGNGKFVLARLSGAGALDAGFGTGGLVITDFDPVAFNQDRVQALFLDDGASQILAAGTGNHNFAAARYAMSNGALDLTYGGSDGKVEADVPHPVPSSESARSVARQPDGKIVAVGPSNVGEIDQFKGDSEFAVARYNPDGSLDDGFGAGGVDGDGRISTNFHVNPDGTGSQDSPEDLAIQSDGKIVVVGADAPSGDPDRDFAIARYEPDGDLDPTFDDDGKVTLDFGGSSGDAAHGVAVQGDPGDPDFRIVVVGGMGGFSDLENYAIAVLDDEGDPDPSFAGDGTTTTDIPGFNRDSARAVATQADGRIVAAGTAGGFSPPNDFSVVRYEVDGDPDPSFGGGDGIATTDFVGGFEEAYAVAIRELGSGQVRIVAAGRASPDTSFTARGGLAAYSTDGAIDPTFAPGGADGDGRATIDLQSGSNLERLRDVAIQPDGKVLAAGTVGPASFGVIRTTPGGVLDPSFAGDGRASTDFGFSGQIEADGLALQPDGRIVAAGGFLIAQSGSDFWVARYAADPGPVVAPPQVAPPPAPPATGPKPRKCKKGFKLKKIKKKGKKPKRKCVRVKKKKK